MDNLQDKFDDMMNAIVNLYERADDLQEAINGIDDDLVPLEHYVSLKDDLSDLIVLIKSGSKTDKMVDFLLQTYFTSNERENILKEAEMVEAVRYEN